MNFKQIAEIVRGDKTQTRRIVRPGERAVFAPLKGLTTLVVCGRPAVAIPADRLGEQIIQRVEIAGRVKWGIGLTYPMRPAYTAESVGRILITELRAERLQDISEDDARAEGVADVAAYRVLWGRSYPYGRGLSWAHNPMVWVISFVVAESVLEIAS